MDTPDILNIGEPPCVDAIPFFAPLKGEYKQHAFRFTKGDPAELSALLERGELDAALTSSIFYAGRPHDFLLLPDLGIATKGHMRSALFFSDMLLDDLDEMTISLCNTSATASAVIQITLNKYLQYMVNYKTGWGDAEGFLLIGDSALRERTLDRYRYVYDVGELWRHYTGHALVFASWIVSRSAASKKTDLVALLARSLRHAIKTSQDDPKALLSAHKNIDWIPRRKLLDHWSRIHYQLSAEDLSGLNQLFKDAYEIELIDKLPDLEYFE